MRRLQLRSASATLIILASSAAFAGSTLSACSGSKAGPVESFTSHGQPIVDVAGTATLPGQPADATAYVVNNGEPVKLVSASVVAVPGYRAGTLAEVGVGTTFDVIGVGYGWPPLNTPVKKFGGAVLPHGESRIIFGISGTSPGVNYATAGILIKYLYQGQEFSVKAWSGLMACVAEKNGRDAANRQCREVSDKFTTAMDHIAGISQNS